MKTTLVWISSFIVFLLICVFASAYEEEKNRQFKIDMANYGLEQCVNPYSKFTTTEVIWVKTCPEHLK